MLGARRAYRGKNSAGEPLLLTPVVHPWLTYQYFADAGDQLQGRMEAITYHLATVVLVSLFLVLSDVFSHFFLQRHLQHPSKPLPEGGSPDRTASRS